MTQFSLNGINMKLGFFFVTFLLAPFAQAIESCELSDLDLKPESAQEEKLFYVGTCHFRNAEYEKSLSLWKELISIENIDPIYSDLQTSAFNNLGYLSFMGYGTPQDKTTAINYWKTAISLGSTEAEYHLCHAYADSKDRNFYPEKAMIHCEKARTLYSGIEEKDEDDKIILNHIEDQIKKIKHSDSNQPLIK